MVLQIRPEQKAKALGAVVPGGKHGGGAQNESDDREQDDTCGSHIGTKGICGKRDARKITRILPVTGDQDDQRCAGADDQCICDRAHHRYQTFANGFICARGTVSHDFGANSRLVGERPPTYADKHDSQ